MSEQNRNVEYREIPGYPGYFAGTDGSIWSDSVSAGRVLGKVKTGFPERRLTERTTKPGRTNRRILPYRYLYIGQMKFRRRAMVHVLVLEAFVGPCPAGMECRHLDGDVSNNNLWNLEWGTKQQNCRDKFLHGTAPIGERSGTAVVNPDIVRQVRALKTNGLKYREVMERFGLKFGTVRAIVERRTWKHVE